MTYVFDAFLLDTERCTLCRDGKEIPLRPKVFDLLSLLVERPGQLTRKEQIYTTLWPDVVVEESSLVQCVSQLRRSLGRKGGELIKTVPRKGYVFETEVNRVPSTKVSPTFRRLLAVTAAVFGTGLLVGWLGAATVRQESLAPELLIDTRFTILGQPLVYPDGPARLVDLHLRHIRTAIHVSP